MTAAESSAIRVVLSGSDIGENRHLLDQLDGALVSQATTWILDIKVSSCATAVDLPDGPFPARAFVPSRSAYQGEVIVLDRNGRRLADLECAWVTDQPPAGRYGSGIRSATVYRLDPWACRISS